MAGSTHSTSINCATCDSRKDNIFCELPSPAVDKINKSKLINYYKRGQTIFYAGNQPSGLYCVNSGVIRLESNSPQGHSHILRVIPKGGILGYRSLFANESYEASAVVHEDAQICLIPKDTITQLIQDEPELALKFLSHVSKELRSAESRLCGLTDKNASERTAEALLFLREKFADQSWTRKDIAEWAGTTPETVMRTLASFENEGLIAQNGRKIDILKKSELMKRANLLF